MFVYSCGPTDVVELLAMLTMGDAFDTATGWVRRLERPAAPMTPTGIWLDLHQVSLL